MSSVTRRGLFGNGAAAAAGAVALAGAPNAFAADGQECIAPPPRLAVAPPGGRIDVHAHHIPDIYREALLSKGMANPGGYPTPVWTPERALLMMEEFGIQLQVLSISDPGVGFLEQGAATTLARKLNEYTAELIKDHPTRFGGYAVIPLPDINAALNEIAYALDVLKLDGIGLLTTYGANNVALPVYEPIWEELNRRKCMVFIHPTALSANDKPSYVLPDFLVEFTFETTRFCTIALNTGLTTRYPDLRLQLAHAGGAFPFLSYRIGVLQTGVPEQVLRDPESVNRLLPARQTEGFYYDTGLASSPAQMASVLEISDVNHVLFGTDFPYTELLYEVPGDPQPLLSKTFNEKQRHAVERANAAAQLPSVAKRLGIPEPDRHVDAKLVRFRVVQTKTRRTQLRLLLEAGETVQVEAVLKTSKRTLASTTFTPLAKGRRTLHWTLPPQTSLTRATLVLTVTDGFGNRTTITRKHVGPVPA
jgi:predicted TIM-barrel fold metal-dependent hydrolase